MRRLLLLVALLASACTGTSGSDRLVHAHPVDVQAGAPVPRACPPASPRSPGDPYSSARGAGAGRVCGYDVGGRVAERLATRSQLAQVVADLLHVPPVPPGTYNCPIDNGSYFRVELTYPHAPAREVLVANSGCRFAGNVPEDLYVVLHS